MTELGSVMQQHWNHFVVKRCKLGVGIHVDQVDADSEFCRHGYQGLVHLLTKMAVGA